MLSGTARQPAQTQKTTFGAARGVLAATWAVVAVNAFHIWQQRNVPPQPLTVEVSQHLYDAGHHLLLGLLIGGVIMVWMRVRPTRTPLDYVVLGVTSFVVAALVLPEDLTNFARRTAPSELLATLTLLALVAVSASSIVLAALVSRWSSPRVRWVVLGLGLYLIVLNHDLLANDYPGVHLWITFLGGALVASVAALARLPSWWPRGGGALAYGVLTVMAGFTLIVWPSPIVLHELLKLDGSQATRFLALIRSRQHSGTAHVPATQRQWFRSRTGVAPIPASAPALLPDDAVLVLITVDALRADVVNGRKHDARLPTLAQLRDESVSFTLARTPSSQTMMSLGTLFAGTYFSQQYWARHPRHPLVWPHQETTPRFPELLARDGVVTATFSGAPWLTNAYGVVRGFREERSVRTDVKYTRAVDLVNATLPRLERHGAEPLFMFLHLLDAHAPYEGSPGASDFERYLDELAIVDDQIARIRQVLRTRFAERAALIITADHGEAFGEHGANYHATSLYEEQVHVPLLISVPRVTPRSVPTPVSLVDLGPTILDLFGLPTPGHFMGESLAGFLRGENPTLTRPIAAEVRLMHMLIDRDGYKSILDDRTHTAEVYDLKRDPGEQRNLNDGSSSAADRVALLERFFATHRNRRPGYKLPYRP